MTGQWETAVPAWKIVELLTKLDSDGQVEYARRLKSGECLIVSGYSIWGVCLVHKVVADDGHHFTVHPDATKD